MCDQIDLTHDFFEHRRLHRPPQIGFYLIQVPARLDFLLDLDRVQIRRHLRHCVTNRYAENIAQVVCRISGNEQHARTGTRARQSEGRSARRLAYPALAGKEDDPLVREVAEAILNQQQRTWSSGDLSMPIRWCHS